ncbi:hypothetical protein Dimus_036633 [Dionaea muscipula]
MCAQDFDSDDEYVPVYSNPKKRISEKTSDRKKRNKLWSFPEVVKLVDGISQFGVGKWIAIRRTFFSSSSYRTSLDIRVIPLLSYSGRPLPSLLFPLYHVEYLRYIQDLVKNSIIV